jgi:ubiquinone/menaquinone biosynthesis C-methylase UbiE
MHLEFPKTALAEMIRVAKTGGKVLVFEVDFETITIDAPDKKLCRKVINAWCDGFRDGWLGRRLPAWFAEMGLRDVNVVPATLRLTPGLTNHLAGADTTAKAVAVNLLSSEEATAWMTWLTNTSSTETLFATMTGFLVVGTKTSSVRDEPKM